MAILETEIVITLHPSNFKHYENKGYIIPRIKSKWGKIVVPKNSKLLVKVNDLPLESHQKLTKICDIEGCGKYILKQSYAEILRERKNGDGKDRCFKCARIKSGIDSKNNIKFENSLEFFAIKNNKKYLLEEYSYKNTKHPSQVSYGTKDEYLWDCPNCNNEYLMRMSTRTTNGSNCPYCCTASKKVLIGFNDLWTIHPEVAKLLKNHQRGYEISYGSGKREEFKCDECGFEQKKTVANIVTRGFSCLCSDGISYPEKFAMSFLNQIDILYLTQPKFEWAKDKKYDFYIPSLNIIIETHGRQHYMESFSRIGGKSLIEEQENDNLKEEMARSNGINYIVIDCRKSELEFIKNNIIESELSILFDISKIDWKKCAEYACSSLVKLASNLWNEGIESTVEIGKILNLERGTVVRYLKQGLELNWCNYDAIKERNKGLMASDNRKQTVQLTVDGKYIKTWNSIIEVKNELGIKSISRVCKGKQKTSGGFKWMYKEDYENMRNKLVI